MQCMWRKNTPLAMWMSTISQNICSGIGPDNNRNWSCGWNVSYTNIPWHHFWIIQGVCCGDVKCSTPSIISRTLNTSHPHLHRIWGQIFSCGDIYQIQTTSHFYRWDNWIEPDQLLIPPSVSSVLCDLLRTTPQFTWIEPVQKIQFIYFLLLIWLIVRVMFPQ